MANLEAALETTYSIADLLELFGVTRVTIEYWKKKHEFPLRKTGPFTRADKREVDAWVERKKDTLPTIARYAYRVEMGTRRRRLSDDTTRPTRRRLAA